MLKLLQAHIDKHHLFSKKDKILLTVSGGVDSVVMCHLFKEATFNFGIAHCNFKLRGKDADKDEQFVKDLAAQLQVNFHNTSFDTQTYAEKNNISIQMAARALRYEWFEKIRQDNQYTFITTAHHLNDSIETVLINLTKGTGISGLHGILPKSGKIIRPLLFSSKEAIIDFAKQNKINFREDASNNDNKYTRNKIRNKIIPLFNSINPEFTTSFKNNIERFRNVEKIYLEAISKIKNKLTENKRNEIWVAINKLLKQASPKTILFEILKDYDFKTEQLQQILDSLTEQSGKQFFSDTHRLVKDRKHLIISDLTNKSNTTFLIETNTKQITTATFKLNISNRNKQKVKIKKDKTHAYLDLNRLKFPLTLRLWNKGDYFYPFGMYKKSGKPGKQKVSDYLINAKIPLSEKESIWVLESNRKIVWLVGHRIDERYRILEKTQKVFTLSVEQT